MLVYGAASEHAHRLMDAFNGLIGELGKCAQEIKYALRFSLVVFALMFTDCCCCSSSVQRCHDRAMLSPPPASDARFAGLPAWLVCAAFCLCV